MMGHGTFSSDTLGVYPFLGPMAATVDLMVSRKGPIWPISIGDGAFFPFSSLHGRILKFN